MQRLRAVLTPWRALLLAALLLAAQAAGLAHRVAHAPLSAGGGANGLFWGHESPQAAAPAPAHSHEGGEAHGHREAHAHGHAHTHAHAGSEAAAECRLFDQLLGAADFAAPHRAVLAALRYAAAPVPPTAPLRSGAVAAAYQARAPPQA